MLKMLLPQQTCLLCDGFNRSCAFHKDILMVTELKISANICSVELLIFCLC